MAEKELLDHRPPPEVATPNRRDALKILLVTGATSLSARRLFGYQGDWQANAEYPQGTPDIQMPPHLREEMAQKLMRYACRIVVHDPVGANAGCGYIWQPPPRREHDVNLSGTSIQIQTCRHVIDDILHNGGPHPVELIFPAQGDHRVLISAPDHFLPGADEPDVAMLQVPKNALVDLDTAGLPFRDETLYPLHAGNVVCSISGGGEGPAVHRLEAQWHEITDPCVRDHKQPASAGYALIANNGKRKKGSSGSLVFAIRRTGKEWIAEAIGTHHKTDAELDRYFAVKSESIDQVLRKYDYLKTEAEMTEAGRSVLAFNKAK